MAKDKDKNKTKQSSNKMTCSECNDDIGADTKFVKCNKCVNSFHLSCRDLTDREYRAFEKNGNFDCGAHKSSSACRIEAKLDKIAGQLTELTKSQQFLSDKYDDLMKSIEHQVEEGNKTKKELQSVKIQGNRVKQDVEMLKTRLNSLEQNNLAKNAVIRGLKKDENPNHAIKKLAEIASFDIDEGQIHSIQNHTKDDKSTLVVQFHNSNVRRDFVKAAKKKRITTTMYGYEGDNKPIFIDEQMTKETYGIYVRAKQLKKYGYKYTWVANGAVLVRETDNSDIIRITSIKQANDIEQKCLTHNNNKKTHNIPGTSRQHHQPRQKKQQQNSTAHDSSSDDSFIDADNE